MISKGTLHNFWYNTVAELFKYTGFFRPAYLIFRIELLQTEIADSWLQYRYF